MTDIHADQIAGLEDKINAIIDARLNPTGRMCGEWMTVPEAHQTLHAAGVRIGLSTLYRVPAARRRDDARRTVLIPTAWVTQQIQQHTNP